MVLYYAVLGISLIFFIYMVHSYTVYIFKSLMQILFTGRCEYEQVRNTLSSGAALGGLIFRTMGGAMDACDAGLYFLIQLM